MGNTINCVKALDLIDRLRQDPGDNKAQEALYGLLREVLLDRLRSKIPPRLQSRIDAEDVLNMAFPRALVRLEGFQADEERSFYAWVYRIGKNLIADAARRQSVNTLHFAGGDEAAGPRASAVPSKKPRAESYLQQRDWIETGLSRLKEREAEVIRLHWLQGYSIEEIASAWQKTPGAVRRFYSRSWEKFRALARATE